MRYRLSDDMATPIEAAEVKSPERLALEDIFDEEPVPLEVFIKDKQFLNHPPLSPIQLDALLHMEHVLFEDTYELMAKEFDPSWGKKIRQTNLIRLCWGKGSSAPYTPIYDAETGRWVRLDSFSGGNVASVDPATGMTSTQEATKSFLEGTGEMFRVTTKRGAICDVWEGHRFLTWGRRTYPSGRRLAGWFAAQKHGTSWERLWDLKVGDKIAVSTFVPEPTDCVPRDPDEIEWIGLCIGDGHFPKDRASTGPSLTIGYQATVELERVKHLVSSRGMSCTIRDDGRKLTLTPAQSGKILRGGNPFREMVCDLRMDGTNCYTKHIPEEYFSLPTDQVALLFSRLIDTDGWIITSNTVEIGYATVSRQLAQDVQRLALRLGVLMNVHEHNTKNQTGFEGRCWKVRVRDNASVIKLASQLSLLDKEESRLRVLAEAGSKQQRRADHGDVMWDEIISIEPLGVGDFWTLTVPSHANYVASGGVVHHNSGKDSLCRNAALRVFYLLSCMRSPQAYFGLPEQDTIHMINIAASAPQASQAFFMPMTRVVRRGWFKDRCDPKQNLISGHKGIECISGNSDAETQEGLNVILGVADEIDAFRSKAELERYRGKTDREPTKSAEGIMNMLVTSAATRFPQTFKVASISFPRYLGSTIMTLCDESRLDIELHGEDSVHYVSGPHCTWDINPRFNQYPRVSIPETDVQIPDLEVFKNEYRRDPANARAKFECRPERSIDTYFRNADAVRSTFHGDLNPLTVTYSLETARSEITGNQVTSWKAQHHLLPDFRPISGALYAIHADLAIKEDRAGVAMAHVKGFEEVTECELGEDGEEVYRTLTKPVVQVDFITAYEASAAVNPHREIRLAWVRDLVFTLIKRGFPIGMVTYDNFQSADSRQTLESHGIKTDRLSTDINADIWRTLRNAMYSGRLTAPHGEFSTLCEKELLALGRFKGKVDHPNLGSKDVADAFACAVYSAIQLGGAEDEDRAVMYPGTAEFGLGESVVSWDSTNDAPRYKLGVPGTYLPSMF